MTDSSSPQIRMSGLANKDLLPEYVLKLGQAAGLAMRRGSHRHRALVGKDPRLSSYTMEDAIAAGLLSVGVDVRQTGPVPRAGVPVLTSSVRCDLGIMISGGSEPYEYTGVWIYGPGGLHLSPEQESALARYLNESPSEMATHLATADGIGRAKRIPGPGERYIEYVKSIVPKLNLEGVRFAIDCANGAAYQVFPNILRELGAEVVASGIDPDGENINSGWRDGESLLRAKVRERRADYGITLNGDATQLFMCDKTADVKNSEHFLELLRLLEPHGEEPRDDAIMLALRLVSIAQREGKTFSQLA